MSSFSLSFTSQHSSHMSIPTDQKALRLMRHAGPYEVLTVPVPTLDPGEILVRIDVAGLNPADWKCRFIDSFAYIFNNDYPAQQGHDIAGTVVKAGEGVTAFAVGDKVSVLRLLYYLQIDPHP